MQPSQWWDGLARLTWRNPVTLKELRVGLRERRIFVLQVLYLFVLLSFSLMLLPELFQNRNSEQLTEAGKAFFLILFWIQLLMLIFTAPALTCGSLSGERERHSLDMVLASRLSSAELVTGKLGFAVYCLALLLFSALPLASICFFLGGVSLSEALASYLELFLFGMIAASIGLFSSAREHRSNYSTVQSYLMVLLACFGLPFYGALRFSDDDMTVALGPYYWTFNQVWEIGIFHFFVGSACYFIAFLFFKARHRLRPQARNVRGMIRSFLVYYGFCLVWGALGYAALIDRGDLGAGEFDPLAVLIYAVNLTFAGFFLNTHTLESRTELAEFQASPFSRRFFWLCFFCLTSAIPLVVHQSTEPSAAIQMATGLMVFFLLVYPVNVWLLQQYFLPRWQFAWVYYLGLLLLQFLSTLGAFAGKAGEVSQLFFLSPYMSLAWAADPDQLGASNAHICESAVIFQLISLLLLLLVYRWRLRRPPA